MSSLNSSFAGILSNLLIQCPLFIVWSVGIFIALTNMKNYPKISIFTLVALGIFLIETIIFSVANTLIPLMSYQYGWTTNNIATFYTISGIIRSLINTVCWGLIIAAIFSCRTKEEYMRSVDR